MKEFFSKIKALLSLTAGFVKSHVEKGLSHWQVFLFVALLSVIIFSVIMLGWLGILFIIFVVSSGFVFFLMGFREVPDKHTGLKFFLGRLIGVTGQGLKWALPSPLGRIDAYSLEEQTLEGEAAVNTREKIINRDGTEQTTSNRVIVKWRVTWRLDENLFQKFRLWTPEKIEKELRSSVNSAIGTFGGNYSYTVFIEKWRAIETMINCTLRLKHNKLPHHCGKKANDSDDNLVFDRDNGQVNVPIKERIDYYEKHHVPISEDLGSEEKKTDERSVVEEKLGIDVGAFKIDKVDFSEEFKNALEKEQAAEKKLGVMNDLLAAQKKALDAGNSHQASLDASLILLGADAHVYNMRGDRQPETYLELGGGSPTKRESKRGSNEAK